MARRVVVDFSSFRCERCIDVTTAVLCFGVPAVGGIAIAGSRRVAAIVGVPVDVSIAVVWSTDRQSSRLDIWIEAIVCVFYVSARRALA